MPIFVLVLLIVTAIFAGQLAPTFDDNRAQNLNFRNHPPTWGRSDEHNVAPDPAAYDLETAVGRTKFRVDSKKSHPRSHYIAGGDNLGRDVLSRVIFGARISLQVAGIALVIGTLVGTTMGLIAGYYGRWVDEILMRLVDVWLALPFILIALVISVIWDPTTRLVMLLIALLAWTPFVRQVRADALSIRTHDYVMAAKIAGANDFRILFRHVLPGTFSTVLVVASLSVGGLIIAESILSFLGIGIPDPIPAWGKSVNDGRPFIEEAWWISFWPGLAIFMVVMSLNFFGDWMRDRLDPRLRQLD